MPAFLKRWPDAPLAMVLSAATLAQYAVDERRSAWFWLPLGLATTVPLLWRRRWPLAAFLVAGIAGGILERPPALGSYAAYLVYLYSVGRYTERYRLAILTFVVCCFIGLQVAVPEAGPPLPRETLGTLIAIALFIAGTAIRSRRHELELLASTREQALATALQDERARIARELHDVVAHGVSLMTVQAGAARRRLREDPAAAEQALKTVESAGRDALAELRRMLTLLAAGQPDAELAPQPKLDQLPALVERVEESGQPVELTIEGDRRPLSPGVELAAYRIAQEALTNAVRHARGARTRIKVGYGEHDLSLEVTTEGSAAAGAPAGAGRGLEGMRERAAMYGGELQAGRRDDGSFGISARLPVEPA